jgi:imidazolonepropionase
VLLIENISSLLTFCDNTTVNDDDDPVVVIDGELIAWVGARKALPQFRIDKKIDAQKNVVMPGFIDSHTHLMFAGSRADEFTRRMNNESYESIMKKGGGIMSTVKMTRAASDEELVSLAHARADAMLLSGVTTVEAKSGYGLSAHDELRLLRLMKKVSDNHDIDIHSTFLGAHVVPQDYKSHREDYVSLVINEMLPTIAQENLALDCDVFCDVGAFSVDEAHAILSRAKELGLGLRMHAQQLSENGGVRLVKTLPLKSLSHADHLSDADIEILRAHPVVIEALPIAALFLRSTRITPIKKLIDANIPLAIATDFNPGSAMCLDLMLAARLGVTYFGFPPDYALRAITKNAALALGKNDRGSIKVGNLADLVITNCHSKDAIIYDWTKHPVHKIIKRGQIII